jgi:hypothetical protein
VFAKCSQRVRRSSTRKADTAFFIDAGGFSA